MVSLKEDTGNHKAVMEGVTNNLNREDITHPKE